MTDVEQCNGVGYGGGNVLECRVSVINNFVGVTPQAIGAATVNQCNGLGARHHRLQPVSGQHDERDDHAVQRLELRRRPGRLQLHRERHDHGIAERHGQPVQRLQLRRRLLAELLRHAFEQPRHPRDRDSDTRAERDRDPDARADRDADADK